MRGDIPAVMPVAAPDVIHFVARVGQGTLHFLVRHPPIAAVDVQIAAAVLQEYADRLGFRLADQCGIFVAAAQTDIRSNCTEHPRKGVGPLPGHGERADGTAAGSADAAIISAGRKIQFLLLGDVRQKLIEEEPGVVVAQAVVLEAAVVAIEGLGRGCLQRPPAARRRRSSPAFLRWRSTGRKSPAC